MTVGCNFTYCLMLKKPNDINRHQLIIIIAHQPSLLTVVKESLPDSISLLSVFYLYEIF